MGHAVLPVSLDVIASMFMLPQGYTIVAAQQDIDFRIVKFLVRAKDLPDDTEAFLPEMTLICSIEYYQGKDGETNYDYKKLTVKPQIIS